MVTIEEILVHPLFLLLIGAVAAALLTHFLEGRRREREIKVDIVSKITEVYGSLSAKVVVATERRKPISNR